MCHPSWALALTEAQRLRDLPQLRPVRDRMDRDYAQPLNVEALARCMHMPAGHLSRHFPLAYDELPHSYSMARRNERANGTAAPRRPHRHRQDSMSRADRTA